MISITKKLSISAGHRLLNHEGACKDLHGHNCDFYVTCRASRLDDIGRVVDFKVVKNVIKGWLDENWDHGMILNHQDPLAGWFSNQNATYPANSPLAKNLGVKEVQIESPLWGQKFFLFPDNPTAENLAKHLLSISNQLLRKHGVCVTNVICQETESSAAEAESPYHD